MIPSVTALATFEYHAVVRMGHTDTAGVWYFTSALGIAHEAWEAWLESRGLPLHQLFAEGRLFMPIVHAEADYFAPVRLGDALVVSLEFAENTGKSMVIACRIDSAAGEMVARTRVIHACRWDGFTSLWPPDFIARLTSPAE